MFELLLFGTHGAEESCGTVDILHEEKERWEGGLESEGNLAQEYGTFPNRVSSTCQEVILEQHDVVTLGRNKGRKRNLGCSLSSVLLWNLIAHFTVHEN